MEKEVHPKKKKNRAGRYIAMALIVIFAGGLYFLYNNFNRLVSEALLRTFNSSLTSDVYDLKFKGLRVNLFEGNIGVNQLVFQPRGTPLNNYPYINSSFTLQTERMNLLNVEIFKLLKEGRLELESISILKPEISIVLDGENPVFFPYKAADNEQTQKSQKKSITRFNLKTFELVLAHFKGHNKVKGNQFEIKDFSIGLKDLSIDQQTHKDLMKFKSVALTVGQTTSKMENSAVRTASFETFSFNVDSLDLQRSIDTTIYSFRDFHTSLTNLDVQTSDSINHIALGSLVLSYKDKHLKLQDAKFKPNISDAEIQKKFRYQQAHFYGSVQHLEFTNVDFDSLIYRRKLFVGEISVDSLTVSLFKDKLKPLDTKRFPEYLGQQIRKIPVPLLVNSVSAKRITLLTAERKPDSAVARVSLNRGMARLSNITNLRPDSELKMSAHAYIDNKVPFDLSLAFSYSKPSFTFVGSFKKFNLMNLNRVIESYTPAKISAGIVDEIFFSGTAAKTFAHGKMRFLYHDLQVDLKLKNQKNWANAALSFAANSIVHSNNPASKNALPRIVNFRADRNMNKGFINVVLKSAFSGLKETVSPL